MSEQLNFYMHPSEYEGVLKFLSDYYDLNIYEKYSSENVPSIIRDYTIENIEGVSESTIYISLSKDINKIILRECSKGWRIDDQLSPVLEFWLCQLNDKTLKRGRFYFRKEGQTPESARLWNRLIRKYRDICIKDKVSNFWVTPGALQWKTECNGEFKQL